VDDPFERYLAEFGAASREYLVQAVGRHRFDNAVKSGQLVAVFPRAYAYPWMAELESVRRRSALLSVGGEAALSHTTVLDVYGLPVQAFDSRIHVTAYLPRHPRGVPDELVVHRTRRPLAARSVDGLPVVHLEDALIASWPYATGPGQRAPMIEAWRRRLVSAARLRDRAERMWWVPELAGARELVGQLLAGCESELELWGYTDVFNVPGLDDCTRQKVVYVGGRVYRLDVAYEDELLNVELDGRAYHESQDQWERDIARDLAVATVGWQTLRFSHRRLTGDVRGCQRDVLAVRAERRRLLRGSRGIG
jgi:very-short-patch-repair endonuclease